MNIKRLTFVMLCLSFVGHLSARQPDSLLTLYPEPDYAFVSEMPAFPGGVEALSEWIAAGLPYDNIMEEGQTNGALEVSFAVGSDGQVFDVQVVDNVLDACEEDVVRIMHALPRWHPAHFAEEPICVRMRLYLSLRLD